MIPRRIKHTFAPPHVCSGCYWEERYRTSVTLNKSLRAELLRIAGRKQAGGRKPVESTNNEREEERDAPDLIDEMQMSMGKLHIDG